MKQMVPLKKDASEFCMVEMRFILHPSQTCERDDYKYYICFITQQILGKYPIYTYYQIQFRLDGSLSLWTLLFLHQVACVSSLTPLYSTQLCEFLCVPDGGEHLGN